MINSILDDIKSLDTNENTLKKLDRAYEAYMTSDYANSKNDRTSVLLLFKNLKKLLKNLNQ